MRRARKAARWLLDWRNGATLAASVLVALLALSFVDARSSRQEAFNALSETTEQGIDIRRAQSRRISDLLTEVERLRDEQAATSSLVGELTSQIEVLTAQIESMGGEPAVSREASGVATGDTSRRDPDTTDRPPSPEQPPPGPPPEQPPPDNPEPEPQPEPIEPLLCSALDVC